MTTAEGIASLKHWLDCVAPLLDDPRQAIPFARLSCPDCERPMASHYGRHARAYFLTHPLCGGRCKLEFATWWGETAEEVCEQFERFCHPVEAVETAPEAELELTTA